MTHKVINNKPIIRNTSEQKIANNKEVANTLVQKAFTPPANNSPSLSIKKVTYSNPLLALINLLLSLFGLSIGSPSEEPIAKAAEPEKKIILPAAITPKKDKSNSPSRPVKSEKTVDTTSKENTKIKTQITELYRAGLLEELKKDRAEQKATAIFNTIFPAFNTGLQKHLETTVDISALKKPLRDLAKTLIAEYEVSQMLQEISVNLAKEELTLDREAIFKAYPSLKEMLEKMPDQKKQFEMILSKTWVANHLKNPSNYLASKLEMSVLKSLGFNPSQLADREFLRNLLEVRFNKDLPLLENLPEVFKKEAFKLRVRSAGVPAEAVENLHSLISFCAVKRKELIAEAVIARDALRIEPRLPKAIAFLKDRFHGQNIKKITQLLEKFLTGVKKENLTSSDFKKSLDSLPITKGLKGRFTHPDENFKKIEAWFVKYEGMIIGEFVQGEDDPDNLVGEGVCLGLSYRMARIALESPDASISKIAVRSVKTDDKTIQDYHEKKSRDLLFLPPEFLATEGKKENILFVATNDLNAGIGLIELMTQPEHLKKLKDSNGGMILGWDGHATFMRFDPSKNKFFLFDPNFTTIEFKKRPDESYEQLAIRMTMAYIELYQWAYPGRTAMKAHQIVPLKAGEPVPTGKIDLDKVLVYSDKK